VPDDGLDFHVLSPQALLVGVVGLESIGGILLWMANGKTENITDAVCFLML
jgi:hypothetical protein